MARKTIAEIKKAAYDAGFRQGWVDALETKRQQQATADLEMMKAATELMRQAGLSMSKAGYLALAVRKNSTEFPR